MNSAVPPTSYHRYKDVVFPTTFASNLRSINFHAVPLNATFRMVLTGFASDLESLYRRFYNWKYRRWLQAGALLWMLYYLARFFAFFRLTPENPATWSFALLTLLFLIVLALSFTRLPLITLHRLVIPPLLLVAWTVVQVNYAPWLIGHYETSIPHILGPFAMTNLTFGLAFRRAALVSVGQAVIMVVACLVYTIPLRAELPGTIALALGALLFFNGIQEQQARGGFLNRLTIYHLVTTDGLTGIANRSYFAERLAEALEAPVRVSLIIYDVDRFKEVNDTYGHAAGDEALRTIGTILTQAAEERGVAGRLGGEEFALYLVGLDYKQATFVADEIAAKIRTTLIPYAQGSFRVTVSGGILTAQPPHELTAELMLQRADDLMYQAKDEGRNRIVRGS